MGGPRPMAAYSCSILFVCLIIHSLQTVGKVPCVRQEGVWGMELHLHSLFNMETQLSDQLQATADLPPRKEFQHPLNTVYRGAQSCSERFEDVPRTRR